MAQQTERASQPEHRRRKGERRGNGRSGSDPDAGAPGAESSEGESSEGGGDGASRYGAPAPSNATDARALPDDFDPAAEDALKHPHLYFNRELSTLDFNRRVLAQAFDERVPLLERIFFLSITASNLDEFFRKRVGGLKRQAVAGVTDLSVDGRRPEEQLDLIHQAVGEIHAEAGRLWEERLRLQLGRDAGVRVADYDALSEEERARLDRYFQENIFPILTPLAVGPGHPFPFLSNLSLSLAVMLHAPGRNTEHFARVKVPITQGRWVPLEDSGRETDTFVPLEQLVAKNLDEVFRGMKIEGAHVFRVTRNADIRREEEEADDLLGMISEELRERRFAPVVRLEVDAAMPAAVRRLLVRELDLDGEDVYESSGLLGHADLMPLARLDRPAHRFSPWSPVMPPRLRAKDEVDALGVHSGPRRATSRRDTDAPRSGNILGDARGGVFAPGTPAPDEAIGRTSRPDDAPRALPKERARLGTADVLDADALPGETDADRRSIFRTLRNEGNLLVHHPYDSFRGSVQRFVEEAAADPKVLAIKQTLYRTSEDSPVVQALVRAAEQGKQVAVLVEVKARFDEKNNIEWGRMLEKSGVHVTYGLVGLKTHAKVTLVVRQEEDGPRTYCHIGTGNYNSETARHYTDLGLLTRAPDTGYDLINLFHYLTGYAPRQHYRTMLVAPTNMRESFERLVRREVEHQRAGTGGRIIAKMNALNDTSMIRELYRASRAGVEIDLVVRGHSLLRPGLDGVSENIRVSSILGRFLEHTRIYYFGNGSSGDGTRDPKVFIGSADWMNRNLDERVEAVQEVRTADLRARLVRILEMALADPRSAWDLASDGRYRQRRPTDPEAAGFQEALMEEARRRVGA